MNSPKRKTLVKVDGDNSIAIYKAGRFNEKEQQHIKEVFERSKTAKENAKKLETAGLLKSLFYTINGEKNRILSSSLQSNQEISEVCAFILMKIGELCSYSESIQEEVLEEVNVLKNENEKILEKVELIFENYNVMLENNKVIEQFVKDLLPLSQESILKFEKSSEEISSYTEKINLKIKVVENGYNKIKWLIISSLGLNLGIISYLLLRK